jgi:hypothetical protein
MVESLVAQVEALKEKKTELTAGAAVICLAAKDLSVIALILEI